MERFRAAAQAAPAHGGGLVEPLVQVVVACIGGVAPRQRSFWLVADAELIVYGATDPAATLTIGDETVPLSADGTFRVQVPFRDGHQLYPIKAVAADGEQTRDITLEFERKTPQDNTNTPEQAKNEWF